MIRPVPNRASILSRTSERDLYSHYSNGVVTGPGKYNSMLRVNNTDNNPSLSVYESHGRLYWKDWGINTGGDVFAFVARKTFTPYNKVFKRINEDLYRCISSDSSGSVTKLPKIAKIKSSNKSIIVPYIVKWNNKNIQYWESYGLDKQDLNNFGVYPIVGFAMKYSRGSFQKSYQGRTAYCYYNGNIEGIRRFQIYVPFSKTDKWYSNLPKNTVHSLINLPKGGDSLIITKSLKDVMVLTKIGHNSIAPPSEGVILPDNTMNYFKKRFKQIYTLYDFDYMGITSSNKMRRLYKTIPLFLTNGRFNTKDYGYKDPSDFIAAKNYKQFINIYK